MTSRLVLIKGTGRYPSICAIHYVTGDLVKDIRKLSVVSENSIVDTISRIRSLGGGRKDAIKLPASIATPATEVTIPRTASPPFPLGRTNAGRAASKADATRLTPAKNRIRVSTILFWNRNLRPALTESNSVSFSTAAFALTDGIRTNSSKAENAIKNVLRSTIITAFIPPTAYTDVASIGCRMVISEPEKERIALVFW